ncbi:MAG: hypothetical protein ACXADC_14935 [Candidatus Thorarchaeota archaeon]|jgi:hypothetical protein
MRNYGGYNDRPQQIITCSDGGYAIVGTAGEDLYPDGGDVLLLRIDNEGNLLWDYSFDLPGRQYGSSVVECPDGGFLICSTLEISSTNRDVWLIKIQSDGQYLWDDCYGGMNHEGGGKIIRCKDGGYAVAGSSASSSILLMRFDENLNLLWRRDFGGNETEFFKDFVESVDGGFAIVSKMSTLEYDDSVWVSGTEDVLIIQTDEDGNQQWNKTYGGTDSEEVHTFVQCADGGFALAGSTYPTPEYRTLGYYHYENWILKVDSTGDILWQKKKPVGACLAYFNSMVLCADEGFALAGWAYHTSAWNDSDIIVQRTDSNGNQIWNYTHYVGVYGSVRDMLEDNGELVIAGYNKTSGFVGESRMFVLWLPIDLPTTGTSLIPLRMEHIVLIVSGLGLGATLVVVFYMKRSRSIT